MPLGRSVGAVSTGLDASPGAGCGRLSGTPLHAIVAPSITGTSTPRGRARAVRPEQAKPEVTTGFSEECLEPF